MNDSSALLNQLRIDRSPPPSSGGKRGKVGIVALAVVVLLALVAGGFALMRGSGVPVRTVTARALPSDGPQAGASLLDASGYVVARRKATVSAKITGKVIEVFIEEGRYVKEGEIVARLDDTNIRAGYDQARAQRALSEASLEQVRVNLANAERDYSRKKDLFAQHFVSLSDLDNAQTTLDGLRAQLQTAERNVDVAQRGLDVAQRNLDDTIVRAPFSGVITDKAAQPGEIVSPLSAGGGFTRTGIGTIVDMDSLEFEIDVNENFINRVTPDQKVTARLNAYPDWQIPAHVIAVIPTADRSKGTVTVRIAIDQKDPRILPEMGVRVSFLAAAEKGTGPAAAGAVLPADAIQSSDGNDASTGVVWIIHEDHVERRAVKLGAKNGSDQTIVAGLTAGERVAVGDFAKLQDGTKIKPEAAP